MQALKTFLVSTMIGGVLFLLPVGIIAYVLGRVVMAALKVGHAIHDDLFPESSGVGIALLLAGGVLVLAAFLAGTFVRTAMGRQFFRKMEAIAVARVPFYMVLSQTVSDMSGSSGELSGETGKEVVLVQFDDNATIGFVIERGARDGMAVVFLPGAPSALSGSVVMVKESQLETLNITPAQVAGAMRRLGKGLAALEKAR